MLEEAQCHLAPAGVVYAQEQDDRTTVVVQTLHFGQSTQPLSGEPLRDQRQEVRNGARHGELVVAGVQESFDGLAAVDASKLVGQAGRRSVQHMLLVNGEVRATM